MPLKLYETLGRYLPFVNNEEANNDRYFKILLEIIRRICNGQDRKQKFDR